MTSTSITVNTFKSENRFRKLLEYQQIYLSYLYTQKSDYHEWRTLLVICGTFIHFIRFMTLSAVDVPDSLVYYLADTTIRMGIARKSIIFLIYSFSFATLYGAYFIKRSEKMPKRQKWTIISNVINDNQYYGVAISEKASKWFIKLTQSITNQMVISISFLGIPCFFYDQIEHPFLWASLGMIINAIAGLGHASFLYSPALLYSFHVYSIAKYFDEKQKYFKSTKETCLIHKCLPIVSRVLIDARKSNQFYFTIIQSLLTVSFTAQVIGLFYILFVGIDKYLMFSFTTFLIINFITGQSVFFLSSAFAQKKVVFTSNYFHIHFTSFTFFLD